MVDEGIRIYCYNCGKRLFDKLENQGRILIKCPKCSRLLIIDLAKEADWKIVKVR